MRTERLSLFLRFYPLARAIIIDKAPRVSSACVVTSHGGVNANHLELVQFCECSLAD